MAIIYEAKKYLFAGMDANALRDKFRNFKKILNVSDSSCGSESKTKGGARGTILNEAETF